MDRFARASQAELEKMLLDATNGGLRIEKAAYPPTCRPASGMLEIRPLGPGFMLKVEPRKITTDDFRLHVLFHGGDCPFGSRADIAGFFHGAVAAAFGLEVDPEFAHEPPAEIVFRDAEGKPLETGPELEPPRRRRNGSLRAKKKSPPRGRAPLCEDLDDRLSEVVRGQEAAVHRIADVVSSHLAKTTPARPESLMLIGPSGCGKTSAIEALPDALDDLGCPAVHVFRIDCNELASEYDVHRFLGPAPGLVGYKERPPLFEALSEQRCIMLLDEFEKAHEEVHTVFMGLLDEGRLTAPNGVAVRAPDAIIAMTSNAGASDLAYELHEGPRNDRWRQQVCRDHLLRMNWPPELVGRIGAFAIFERLEDDAVRVIAEDAIRALAREYGLELIKLPPVIVDAALDIADAADVGARALNYSARELLGQPFAEAARAGLTGEVSLDAGPPPTVSLGKLY
jgi:ATP-dependent Clp protease ATP-binding subunit ClpB